MSVLQSMSDSFADPRTRHAILVHFPVALGTLATIPTIALACTAFRNQALRIAAIAMLLIASAGAGLAAGAGEEAEALIDGNMMTAQADETLGRHESLGDGGWMWPLGAAAILAISFVKKMPVRIGAGSLGVLASIGVAGWVGLTAHYGGQLVYHHGVGTRIVPDAPHIDAPPPASPADDGDD
ncbi:MAG: hypothetical protein RBS39_08985 [Phycisphaerales bacterium]|jgi:uncharacterized membrane protein|nr:hypothetical protein [Phycisphaerales bacterium]